MSIEITPRRALAFLAAAVILYFAGYGVGNISAKAYAALTETTSTQPANVLTR